MFFIHRMQLKLSIIKLCKEGQLFLKKNKSETPERLKIIVTSEQGTKALSFLIEHYYNLNREKYTTDLYNTSLATEHQ